MLAGSAVTLGFAIAPPVTASVDPLDPRRFAVVGAEPRPLAAWLLLAGLLSVPVLVVLVLAVSLAVAWTAQGASVVASVASIVRSGCSASARATPGRLGRGVFLPGSDRFGF